MIIVITQRIDNPVYVFLTQICPPESALFVNSFFNEIVPQPLRNVFKMCICNYLVAIDGRSEKCKEGTKITLRRAPYDIKVVKRSDHRYFNTLREKMMWGADTR